MKKCLTLAASVLLLVACSKVSEENYDKVTTGMTLSQVERILGKGDQDTTGGVSISSGGVMGGSSSANSRRQTYTWKDGQKQVVIEFMDDKVLNKRKINF